MAGIKQNTNGWVTIETPLDVSGRPPGDTPNFVIENAAGEILDPAKPETLLMLIQELSKRVEKLEADVAGLTDELSRG